MTNFQIKFYRDGEPYILCTACNKNCTVYLPSVRCFVCMESPTKELIRRMLIMDKLVAEMFNNGRRLYRWEDFKQVDNLT